MFEKLILKKPFERLLNKAIIECKKSNYESIAYELDVLEKTMKIFIEDMIKEKLGKNSNITKDVLKRRLNKGKEVLYKLLEKKLKKMKKNKILWN